MYSHAGAWEQVEKPIFTSSLPDGAGLSVLPDIHLFVGITEKSHNQTNKKGIPEDAFLSS